MKRLFGMFYATLLILLMVAGEIVIIFGFADRLGWQGIVWGIFGFALSCIFAPTFHELGHVAFAKAQGMRLKMTKFSFFRFAEREGKLRFSFASPFSTEETQAIPVRGGNMKKRALWYTAGGLIFGGIYAAALTVGALLVSLTSSSAAFLFWGGLPYAAYLFFLNLPPCVYKSGKTDGAVFRGIAKNFPAESVMVSAMEIYGRLSEEKSFSEIDKKYYFDVPQLPEDEPVYAMILDLRYRYYLEKGETERAADCLNRLASAAEYLPGENFEEIAAELVYMHSLNGDAARAEEAGKLCRGYLSKETATAKRILSVYSFMRGETEAAKKLKEQAGELLEREPIGGVRKFERILLARIPC